MRKSSSFFPRRRQWLVIGGFFGASLLVGSPTSAGATDIYTSSYGGTNDTGGGAPLTTGTFNLNVFTITGIYGTGGGETLFVTDGTANARIYGTAPAGAAVGQEYTATVTASAYQGTEELKTATNFTLQSATATVTPQSATLAQVASTLTTSNTANPFTSSPADSLYASEGSLLFAPVTFTITPTTSGNLSTTTSTALIDQATGDTVILYRSTSATGYTAGQAYTVTGYEQPYNGSGTQESEIVGATSFTASFAAPTPLDRQTTSGSWAPSGGTDWATTTAGPGNTGWINDGTYTAFFQKAPTGAITINAGGIKATGLEFDVTGYNIASDGAAGDNLTLQNSGLVTVTNASDTATISAPIAGSVGLNKNGAGTLILSGANTYTGTTTITAGTLQVSADTALGATGTPVALAGGTLQSGLTTGTLTLARSITGGGGLGVAANSTLALSGFVNVGGLTLPGGGTVVLTNTDTNVPSSGANNVFTGLTFQTAGGSLQTQNAGTDLGLGIVDVSTGGFTATQASGTVSASAIFQATGTVPISVPNAGATLTLNGRINGSAVLAKTGAGTLVLASDNSGLVGSGTTTLASFRQGTAGASPTTGGIVSIRASANPNTLADTTGGALGTGQFQANGGTISNDSGKAITLTVASISLGAQDATATPGGLVFAGGNAITVTGPISLFKGGTTTYQHAITVNTPTTFTGVFTASANTTTSTGVTILGSSTLTLKGTAPNTFLEPVTIATSGANAGVIAGADGTFAANTAITLNAGASLTLNTGATAGTVNAINDAALVSFLGSTGTFGKMTLSIGTGMETVGGLFLAAADGTLAAGYLPAGTYGSSTSQAMYKDNALFSGSGMIFNAGTAVPEPSAWAAIGFGGLLGLVVIGRRR